MIQCSWCGRQTKQTFQHRFCSKKCYLENKSHSDAQGQQFKEDFDKNLKEQFNSPSSKFLGKLIGKLFKWAIIFAILGAVIAGIMSGTK